MKKQNLIKTKGIITDEIDCCEDPTSHAYHVDYVS